MSKLVKLCVISMLLMFSLAQADVPHLISYQARLTDNGGNAVADGNYQISFSIYDDLTGGNLLWTEVHNAVNVKDGSFTVYLGSLTSLEPVVFADTLTYLEMNFNNENIAPRSRLLSVPYAYHAGSFDGGDINGSLIITPIAFASYGNAITILDSNGDTSLTLSVRNSGSGTVDFYDPVDFIPGFNSASSAGTSKVASLSKDGLLFFGATEDDTTIQITPDGDINSTGQIVTGGNDGDIGATVFGFDNTASGDTSTVSGGTRNFASGHFSTVGGGLYDTATGNWSVISGGRGNDATGAYSTISGGVSNFANGWGSTVIGGYWNKASDSGAVAGGIRAFAKHRGSIVLYANPNDVINYPYDSLQSGGSGQMVLGADKGFYITNTGGTAPYDPTKLINTSSGGYLTSGGVWTNSSDENLKENFQELDDQEILNKISELDIYKWNYINENDEKLHIGPTAQDFHELFGLGNDDKSISTIDPSGVALVAIKALVEKNSELESYVAAMETELEVLKTLVKELLEKK